MIKYGDRISLTMITLNEELSVKKVIEDIKKLDERIEIVIVDSSDDQTAEIANHWGRMYFYNILQKDMDPQWIMLSNAQIEN